MQRLEVSGAVRPIYGSLGFKRLIHRWSLCSCFCHCIATLCLQSA